MKPIPSFVLCVVACVAHGAFGAACGATEPPTLVAVGEWSKPVSDTRGYAIRGRLVLCERRLGEDRRETAVYVELQDASEGVGSSMRIYCDFSKIDFRPEAKSGLSCELRDHQSRVVPATGYPFSGAVPKSEWVTLPSDATIRLRTTPFGIHRPKAMAISPTPNQLWVINDGDPHEYTLTGKFDVNPTEGKNSIEDPHIWRGTIEFPPVRFTNARTQSKKGAQ